MDYNNFIHIGVSTKKGVSITVYEIEKLNLI